MDCHEAIIEPIFDSNDRRLRPEYPPLPFLLVALWQDNQAPVAPYLEHIAWGLNPTTNIEWERIFDTLAELVN
jgi:hypothetical protein